MVKFKVGDRVRFSKRIPRWIGKNFQKRTRIITRVHYYSQLQACLYSLGNSSIPVSITFRSYELVLAPQKRQVGRPREKSI